MTPRATYRLQFSAAFGFNDAAAVASYIADLGVSHVYASPIFAARPGSTHGYDVVDHARLNPELGTDADFRAMVAAFRSHDLGLILDIVPNHMGVGGAHNLSWLSVLEWGEQSPRADWFDIDWNAPTPGLKGKLLVPFLGASYGETLAAGELRLRVDPAEGTLAVWAHGTHKLPICPRHYGDVLRHAPALQDLAVQFDAAIALAPKDARWPELKLRLAERLRDPHAAASLQSALDGFAGEGNDPNGWTLLDELIARQHWRASKYNFDRDAINYRRFFTISDLAGLRVEAPEVFDATHRLVLALVADGTVDGLRIDHIDGLRDPKAYVLHLREQASRPFYLLVEKILAHDERLPTDWAVDGTTGYEVTNLLVGLTIDPRSTEALTETYAAFIGKAADPEAVVLEAKLEIMNGAMAAEIEALAARLYDLAQAGPRTRDFGRNSLRTGLAHIVAGFDVYRTYADATGMPVADRARVASAVARARRSAPAIDPAIFDVIAQVLTLDLPEGGPAMLDCALRAQQATGPIMAKGLEDTALYRYNRLIALNEVGSEPGRYSIDVAAFHAANLERLAHEPDAMLATSTHDTKRGEDARMRIAAISRRPELWRDSVAAWRALLSDGARDIDPNETYFFFQLLLGVWPMAWRADATLPPEALSDLRERVEAAMLKSVREASRNTRWVFGDADYDDRLRDLIARAFASPAFLASFRAAVAQFAADGASAALVQTALKLTMPGVPDIYQGSELWEQSLVDPDNRRPVDFDLRRTILRADEAAAPLTLEPGAGQEAKLAMIRRLLSLRRDRPALFARGAYEPVAIQERTPGRALAYLRRAEEGALLVVAALDWRREDHAAWQPLQALPARLGASGWRDLLGGDDGEGGLFERLPVAVLVEAPTARQG